MMHAVEMRFDILTGDDRQRILVREEGTVEKIEQYANEKKIKITKLKLMTQKRCAALGALTKDLERMFYHPEENRRNLIKSVKVFDRLADMETWIERKSETSQAKYIAPYCWKSNPNEVDRQKHIEIGAFKKFWIPRKEDLVDWFYSRNKSKGIKDIDQVACIYSCQGLELDQVAFIWWDDLKWDPAQKQWIADIEKSANYAFCEDVRNAGLTKDNSKKGNLKNDDLTEEGKKVVTELIKNTYYVMLSRAKEGMGIWFKDQATKEYVTTFLGLKTYKLLCGTTKRVSINNKRAKKYSYIECDDGKDYAVGEDVFETIQNVEHIWKVGKRVSFEIDETWKDELHAKNVVFL